MYNLLNNIKEIITIYIQNYYNDYINDKKILKIKNEFLQQIIVQIYESYAKDLKTTIRHKLREIYKQEYSSATVENILLDIFQDSEIGINKITQEIENNQNINTLKLTIPVINNSLNINIQIIDNFVIIQNIDEKKHTPEIYEQLQKYKFLYSLNGVILEEIPYNNKIECILSQIKNKTQIDMECYLLKI
jgi:hypothetical protein